MQTQTTSVTLATTRSKPSRKSRVRTTSNELPLFHAWRG